MNDLQRFNQLSYRQKVTYVCGSINSLHHNHKRFRYTANLNRTIQSMKIAHRVDNLFNQITETIPLANLIYKIHKVENTIALIIFLSKECDCQINKLNRSIKQNEHDYRVHKIVQRNSSLIQYWLTTNISNHNNIYLNINGNLTIIKSITLNYNLMQKLEYYLVGIYYGGISCLNDKELPHRPVVYSKQVLQVIPTTLQAKLFNISKITENKKLKLFNSS